MLYTTETYIGSHCTVGTITLRHDQERRSYTKSIGSDARLIYSNKKKKELYEMHFTRVKYIYKKKQKKKKEKDVTAISNDIEVTK